MIAALDLLLFGLLIATALLALRARDLLTAVALLSAYSIVAALLFAGMQAVDVAFVEAVLGAGVTSVLLVIAVLATSRRASPKVTWRRGALALPVIVVFCGLVLLTTADLPDRGDPEAPSRNHISQEFLDRAYEDTETPNVVTALLADYRSMDTLGETLVILTAALAAALVLFRAREDDE